MARQVNNRNNGITWRKAASTTFEIGDFVEADGSGRIVPSTGAGQLLGICNEQIQATDSDFTSTRRINVSEATYNDLFEIPVITGSATSALEGTYVDVDPTDPRGVDVTASVAQQILVVKVISATLIHGKIAQCCISSS